jgi:hypothetical protein
MESLFRVAVNKTLPRLLTAGSRGGMLRTFATDPTSFNGKIWGGGAFDLTIMTP